VVVVVVVVVLVAAAVFNSKLVMFDALYHYIAVSVRYLCICCVHTWTHGSHIILSTQTVKRLPISTLFEFLTSPVSAAFDIFVAAYFLQCSCYFFRIYEGL